MPLCSTPTGVLYITNCILKIYVVSSPTWEFQQNIVYHQHNNKHTHTHRPMLIPGKVWLIQSEATLASAQLIFCYTSTYSDVWSDLILMKLRIVTIIVHHFNILIIKKLFFLNNDKYHNFKNKNIAVEYGFHGNRPTVLNLIRCYHLVGN